MELVFLETWFLGPLLMLAVACGGGLLVRRLAGGALSGLMVLPVGFALAMAVTAFLTAFGPTARLAAPSLVVIAIAGFAIERHAVAAAVRGRAWASPGFLWPAAVTFAAFAVVAAPVFLTGHVTYTGYARIVDIAHQFDFTHWLVNEGRVRPETRDFSYREVVTKTLDIGYPAGGQSALGSFAQILGVDIPWVWQPFMAVNGGMLALGLYALLGRAIDNRPFRALAATIAAQPNILYGYALVGGIKEFTSAMCLVACAALLPPLLTAGPQRWRDVIPLGVAAAAAVAAFSLTIGPWLAVIVAGIVVVQLASSGRLRALGRLGVVAVVALALSAPTVYLAVTKLLPVAGMAEGAASARTTLNDLGNLGAPVPIRSVAGIWISGDYRNPVKGDTTLTNALIVLALLLVVAGLVRAIRRRDLPLLLVGASVTLAVLYFAQRTGPWIQFKGLTTSAPIVLAMAFVGAAALGSWSARFVRRGPPGLLGWVAAAVLAGGVLLGNAYAYHDVTLAPHDRMRDLQRLGGELPKDAKFSLMPSWEEAGEYFLRDQHLSARPNGFLQVRPGVPHEQQFSYDLDEMAFSYVQAMDLVVVRRAPSSSRAPANYRLLKRTKFYDVWQRAAPASTVLEHVASPDVSPAERKAACVRLQRRTRSAQGSDLRLAYVEGTYTTKAPLGSGTGMSANWAVANPDAVLMYGPGQVERGIGLPAGTFDVWISGPIARAVKLELDGRELGEVSDAWSYPGTAWNHAGVLTTRQRDDHVLKVSRGGGSLAPGDGAKDQAIGPVVFARREARAGEVRYAPVSQARRLCDRIEELDWIELVRGLGPKAQLVSESTTSR